MPKDPHLPAGPDETGGPDHLRQLLDRRDFIHAFALAKKLMHIYPNDPAYPIALAICQMHLGKPRPAVGVLRKADAKFPNNTDILTNLGTVLHKLREYDEEEKCLRKLLGAIPGEERSRRASAHTALGRCLWEQHKREDALSAWRRALEEDPAHREAEQELHAHTNEYGEAKAPSRLFDDIYHFSKIHQRRYLQMRGKDGFSTLDEVRKITGAIQQAWNTHTADWRSRLDSMTPAEKTSLFESVTVDFEARFIPLQATDPTGEEDGILADLDRIFPFLPPGGAMILPFAVPALSAFGLKEQRLTKLFAGARPTRREIEVLIWAHDVVSAVLAALDTLGREEELEFILEARNIAGEMLDDDAASAVVLVTRKILKEKRAMVRRRGKKRRRE